MKTYQQFLNESLKIPKLQKVHRGTTERSVERLEKGEGFRPSKGGMLGSGVYVSRSSKVADSYRGAGTLRGLPGLKGEGPRVDMIVPKGAGRTFRGATVLPKEKADKAYNLSKKIKEGKYAKSKLAQRLSAELNKEDDDKKPYGVRHTVSKVIGKIKSKLR